MKPLDEMISKLPPEYQQEVEDFVELLLVKRAKRKRGTPNLIGLVHLMI